MMRWGDRWLFPDGARVELTHTDCGSPVHAVLQCEAGHEVDARELSSTSASSPRLREPASRSSSA